MDFKFYKFDNQFVSENEIVLSANDWLSLVFFYYFSEVSKQKYSTFL